jgi:hypothetical protein
VPAEIYAPNGPPSCADGWNEFFSYEKGADRLHRPPGRHVASSTIVIEVDEVELGAAVHLLYRMNFDPGCCDGQSEERQTPMLRGVLFVREQHSVVTIATLLSTPACR